MESSPNRDARYSDSMTERAVLMVRRPSRKRGRIGHLLSKKQKISKCCYRMEEIIGLGLDSGFNFRQHAVPARACELNPGCMG
ncbi:MAG: hypothetical protein IKK38_02245, partial [Spirochaetaceae bacterium]|nr:hypothetical protein [Spirochaetaceae bacterium]